MTLKDFQESLQSLSEAELMRFLTDILRRSGRFRDVHIVHGALEFGKDVEAYENNQMLSKPRRWIFQVKNMRVVSMDMARYMTYAAKAATTEGMPTQIVLATSGTLSAPARAVLEASDIQVWDPSKLAELTPPELIDEYFGVTSKRVRQDSDDAEKAATFRAALKAVTPGKEQWPAYQRLIADILEFLFNSAPGTSSILASRR